MTRTVNIFKRDSSIMTQKMPLFLLQAEKSKTLFSRCCCWLVILLQPAPLFVCLLDLQGWVLFKQATQLVLAFITVNRLPCQPFLCPSLRLELFLLKIVLEKLLVWISLATNCLLVPNSSCFVSSHVTNSSIHIPDDFLQR